MAGFFCCSLGMVLLSKAKMTLKHELDVTRETRDGLHEQ
jgi:hypothetical protein